MDDEIGIYAMGAAGADLGRVAGIARYLPNAAVYASPEARDILAYHQTNTIVPRCMTPGCHGLGPRELAEWVQRRNPARLVMDSHPYGVRYGECLPYIRMRRSQSRSTYYVHQRRNNEVDIDRSDFTHILTSDRETDLMGIDLFPILPFEADELSTASEARAQLGGRDRPLVMHIGPLPDPATEFLERWCRKRGADHVVVSTYPAMKLMPGADYVVGYVGYDQIAADALGVPMGAVENYENPQQDWRANTSPPEIAETIVALEVRDAPERATYVNRARRAAALISGNPDWSTI